MRRKDQEIKDRGQIDQIISMAQVCRLGLCRDGMPYIVPVSFGYDGSSLYFHTAVEGMKIDFIDSNRQVCFEMEHDVQVIADDLSACKWTVSFFSVVGFGIVHEITDAQQKSDALNRIMVHYSNREWEFDEGAIGKTRLWRIDIEQISGKRSKDKTMDHLKLRIKE